jgi:hypothetical protein
MVMGGFNCRSRGTRPGENELVSVDFSRIEAKPFHHLGCQCSPAPFATLEMVTMEPGATDFRPGTALYGNDSRGSVLISMTYQRQLSRWTTGPLSSRHKPRSVSGSPPTRPMRKCTPNFSLWHRCGEA